MEFDNLILRLPGGLLTKYRPESLRAVEGISGYYSGPGINQTTQPDTIIPEPYNSLDYQRYAYVRYNPLKYVDPSGHRPCNDEAGCDGETSYTKRTSLRQNKSSSKSQAPQGNSACSGPNRSVVCRDQTLVSNGQVQTPAVYPTYQIPDIYDGPYADEKCVHPAVCGILIIADLVTAIQYQSNLPAYISDSYVFANVSYEKHSGEYGNYTVVTGLEISNSTDTTLSFDSLSIDNKPYVITHPFIIRPSQTMIIQANFHAGSSVNMNFSSSIYNTINLSVEFP